MPRRDHLLDVAAVATAACAVLLTGVAFVHPSWLPVPGADGQLQANRTPVPNWRKLTESGYRIGPEAAAMTIVEFGDFQCPFCGAYALSLDSVRAKYPNDFAIAFHQFPLAYHERAYPLARAADCANKQGRFPAFYDVAYRHQEDQPPVTPLGIGLGAGIPDSARYAACIRDTNPVVTISKDLATARRLGIPGTPGIIVDGMLYSRAPGAGELEALVRQHVKEKSHR